LEAAALLSGLLTGFIVGLTGVGGGSLMTPVLILWLGVPPQTAVGTDLLFATITKLVAVGVHSARQSVDWQIVRRLSCGSVPAVLVVLALVHHWSLHRSRSGIILTALGIALLLTGLAMLLRRYVHAVGRYLRTSAPEPFKRMQPVLTVLAGAVLGALVTLTSVGAGALGTVMLVYLYPLRLTPVRLVGTDLAHAIPVVFLASLGHLALGTPDLTLLGWLLAGSLPGAWIGARLSGAAPDGLLRGAIAVVLLVVGAKLLI